LICKEKIREFCIIHLKEKHRTNKKRDKKIGLDLSEKNEVVAQK
jgi:hypothetical protein